MHNIDHLLVVDSLCFCCKLGCVSSSTSQEWINQWKENSSLEISALCCEDTILPCQACLRHPPLSLASALLEGLLKCPCWSRSLKPAAVLQSFFRCCCGPGFSFMLSFASVACWAFAGGWCGSGLWQSLSKRFFLPRCPVGGTGREYPSCWEAVAYPAEDWGSRGLLLSFVRKMWKCGWNLKMWKCGWNFSWDELYLWQKGFLLSVICTAELNRCPWHCSLLLCSWDHATIPFSLESRMSGLVPLRSAQ